MGEQAIKIHRKLSGSVFGVSFFFSFFFQIPVEGEVTVLVHWETSSFKHISFSLQIPSVPAAAEPVNSSSSKTSQSSPGASWLPETSAARGGQEVRRAGRKVRAKVLPLPCRRGTFILPVSLRPATLHVVTQVKHIIGVSGSVSAFIIFLCFFFVFFSPANSTPASLHQHGNSPGNQQ